MKVHRIITTIEVENDNSITSVELTKLYPTNAGIPFVITNLTTNGSADDIKQVYNVISRYRLGITGELKSTAKYIDKILDYYKSDTITDDNTINEINDDLVL